MINNKDSIADLQYTQHNNLSKTIHFNLFKKNLQCGIYCKLESPKDIKYFI